MTVETNETVDFPKATWDFPREDGSAADTLAEFGAVLCVGPLDAALLVMTYPFPDVVPAALRAEAEDELGK